MADRPIGHWPTDERLDEDGLGAAPDQQEAGRPRVGVERDDLLVILAVSAMIEADDHVDAMMIRPFPHAKQVIDFECKALWLVGGVANGHHGRGSNTVSMF